MRGALHIVAFAAAAALVASAQAEPPRGRAPAEPRGAAMLTGPEPLHAFVLEHWQSSQPLPLRLNALLGAAPVVGPFSLSTIAAALPAAAPMAALVVHRDAVDVEPSDELVAVAVRSAQTAAGDRLTAALGDGRRWELVTPLDALAGELPEPVRGRVAVPFGPFRVPGLYTTVRHPGQTWRAEQGAEVSTVGRGIVRLADELNGYGLVVIMDHGAGYYSVYAYLSRVDAEVGTLLEAGTVIGAAGETETGEPGLYFELRRFDEALDPTDWIQPIR